MSAIGVAPTLQGQVTDGRSTLAAGVIVAAVAGSSVIYQVVRLTLRTRSALHLGSMAVTVLPALLLSGWFELTNVWDVLTVVATFLGVGLVLWLGFWFAAKENSRRATAQHGTSAPARNVQSHELAQAQAQALRQRRHDEIAATIPRRY